MSTTLDRSSDEVRRQATAELDQGRRAALGQFMTPNSVADFMASLFQNWSAETSLLDPGAGTGSLSEAFAAQFVKNAPPGARLNISAFEIDPLLLSYLREHLRQLEVRAADRGYRIENHVREGDFIREATFASAFGGGRHSHVILNPPYKKIAATSEHRRLLRGIGVEVSNLYAAFLALSVLLTAEGGEIVGIVPRSFCNGTYFRLFRSWLLERVALTHIHVFESRTKAFREDHVLQENIIVRLVRGVPQVSVTISKSNGPTFDDYAERVVSFAEVVKPADPERFIHVPTLEKTGGGKLFSKSLSELGLEVCTGPVVDFRMKDYLSAMPVPDTVPLLYAHHFSGGALHWPREHKKPNAIRLSSETRKWMMPRGWYAITKRFSSKEERRRLVAHVFDPGKLPFEVYGFENHLNVIHARKQGIEPDLARGIALFLNSTIVDEHFRTFSGHTQVNATDLRSMRFPSKATIVRFGKWAAKRKTPTQAEIDEFVESHND